MVTELIEYVHQHKDQIPDVICSSGNQYWYQNGMLHREDGPAIVYASGTQKWYQNGRLHRLDGPAIIFGEHLTFLQNCHFMSVDMSVYWVNGTPCMTIDEFQTLANLSDEDVTAIVLKYGDIK